MATQSKPDSYWKETYEKRRKDGLARAADQLSALENEKTQIQASLNNIAPEKIAEIHETISKSQRTAKIYANREQIEDFDTEDMKWEDGPKKGELVSEEEKKVMEGMELDRRLDYWKKHQTQWEQGEDPEKEEAKSSIDLNDGPSNAGLGQRTQAVSSYAEANESHGGTAEAGKKMMDASERFTAEMWGPTKAMVGKVIYDNTLGRLFGPPTATPNPKNDLTDAANTLSQPAIEQTAQDPQNQSANEREGANEREATDESKATDESNESAPSSQQR